MTSNFDNYYKLIEEVDKLAGQLSNRHKNHLSCKKGCDLCCMNYGVFPIEYYALKKSIQEKPVDFQQSTDGGCIFLKDHGCLIYENRPVICRTHGLPLLFMNDDQWELSACELNFTEFDDEEFTPENTFPQDTFNSKLFMINKKFIEDEKLDYSAFDLIEVSQIAEDKQ